MWPTLDLGLKEHGRHGLYAATIAVALVVTVYCAILIVGLVFRLLFIATAAALGVMGWRAWRTES